MDDLVDLPLNTFFDRLARRSPTPGGGGAAAVNGALACALGRMVAAYSIGPKTEPAVKSRVEQVQHRLRRADELGRALVTRDAQAYALMTERAKAAKQGASAEEAYQGAVLTAVAAPMEVAAIACNAIATMDEFKDVANKHLLSDLGIAAVMADATVRAARYTVLVNVGEVADKTKRDAILKEIDRIVAHSVSHRESVEAFVGNAIEQRAANGR